MSGEEQDSIREMLEAHNTLTLATCSDGKPWAASLFFASDADLNLYFVSDDRTRHARDLEAGSGAVVTVNVDCGRWADVKGLQIAGQVDVLEGAARLRGLDHFLRKFADVRALFEMPKSRDEESIAQRLRAAKLYRLKPRWIRLIDNSRGFGYKFEVELKD
jgi:uncharacterized protein YhbP (UPF0306 family)